MVDLPQEMADLRMALPSMVADLEQRAPYASALLLNRRGLFIRIDDREEQVSTMAPQAGTVLSAFDGLTIHERAIQGFSREAAQRSTQQLRRAIESMRPRPINLGAATKQDYATQAKIAPGTLSLEEKLERLHALHQRARGLDPRIVNVRIQYQERSEQSVFHNRVASLGQQVERLILMVVVFIQEDGNLRYNHISKSATGGWESLVFSDEELQHTVAGAVAMLSAGRIEPGEYTIIAAPGVTGTLVHESFGHGVETDMFLKERARAAHYIDKTVGSPLVNILDDPSVPGAPGSYFFDDEGWLAGPTHIVENGIFRQGISDFYSATTLGIPRTANGRRQDATRKAYARMSNTFFDRGQTPVADLFAQVDSGVYLEKWESGMEDPQGWGIQVTCLYGREIKNGKVTDRYFSPVGITGYVPDVLQSITAVGDDFELDGGTCGKGHKEWIPVSSGGPHILMKARLG